MNKFCHTGFSQIQELYNQHVEQIDSALQHCKETPCTNGMAGEPIPYQLRNDFAVTGIVFLCSSEGWYIINLQLLREFVPRARYFRVLFA